MQVLRDAQHGGGRTSGSVRVQGRHQISACAVSAEVVPLLHQQRADTGLLQLI